MRTNYRLMGRVRAVPRLCELYPGICLTTEEKAWKNLSVRVENNPVSLKVVLRFYLTSLQANTGVFSLIELISHCPIFVLIRHSTSGCIRLIITSLPYFLPANIPPGSHIWLFLYRFIFHCSFYYLTRQAIYA